MTLICFTRDSMNYRKVLAFEIRQADVLSLASSPWGFSPVAKNVTGSGGTDNGENSESTFKISSVMSPARTVVTCYVAECREASDSNTNYHVISGSEKN
jgi:hypothetical protein